MMNPLFSREEMERDIESLFLLFPEDKKAEMFKMLVDLLGANEIELVHRHWMKEGNL